MTATNALQRGERAVDVVHLPTAEPRAEAEVLVVGAGPAGLATAVELAQLGVDVEVADRATSATLVRAGAMGHSSRTVELFRRWRVAQRIRDGWTVPPEWHTGHEVVTSLVGHRLEGTRPRAFRRDPARGASAEDAIRRPQTVLQRAFLERLGELDVPVSSGWAWLGAEQHDDAVVSTLEHAETGERRTVRSLLLVGADGSGSAVRRAAGIEREGAYATERMVRFVVRVDGDYPAAAGWAPSATNIVVNDRYSGFLAALDERHWRVYAGPYPVDVLPDEAELARHAHAAFGAHVGLEVVAVHPFYPSKRIAERFRAGRVLLVGDAAHVRAPGGNLGEGFGDVVNLGWKAAAVLRGVAPLDLLDAYDAERRPHNHRVADHASARAEQTARNVAAARALGFPADDDRSSEAEERRRELGAILARGQRPAPGVVFDERYDNSPIVADEPGDVAPWDPHAYDDLARPGHRAPDGEIDPFGGRLYDRIGAHHVLLALSEAARDAAPAAVRAAESRGIVLDVVVLLDEEARRVYGAELVLVRPDHHVAWRGDAAADVGAALDVAFARASASARLAA